jgi:hypothetical protein
MGWGDVRYCPPFLYFHGNCDKVCPTDCDFFLAYLIQLDVDITGNITANLCEVGSGGVTSAIALQWQF